MGACCSSHKRPADYHSEGKGGLPGDGGAGNRIDNVMNVRNDNNVTLQKSPIKDVFSGIALFQIHEAKMKFKDKWFACVTLGEQTFRTATSINTYNPVWNSKKSVALEETGPRLARVSVFETNIIKKNNIVGVCDLDLSGIFTTGDLGQQEKELYDPVDQKNIVGIIKLNCKSKSKEETEKDFAERLLHLADRNDDKVLSQEEFVYLIKAFGNLKDKTAVARLFATADADGDGKVSIDELADLVIHNKQAMLRIPQCPVCGEKMTAMTNVQSVVHMSLCFDNGTGSQIMQGGFLTEKQAAQGWMFKLSEWAVNASYDVGLNEGAGAMHIIVFDRQTGRLVEELIDPKIVLAMRAIYQSRAGLVLLDVGTKKMLESMSKKQGAHMATEKSAEQIPKFIEFFKDQLDMDDVLKPASEFKTFNEFFIRELKPSARPISRPDDNNVAVCAADCRLMAFRILSDSTRLWIKGRKFSVAGLLGNAQLGRDFDGGSLVIFRLAPQDYHRFHSPVSGTLGKLVEVPGNLFTVNPIAVNSKYCNVFTENKRVVTTIHTKTFGEVAFVAIGATMVGSITFTKEADSEVKKGDELGYFSFGGSTCIAVFKAGAIELEKDLLENSDRSLETLVRMGQTLGTVPGVNYPQSFTHSVTGVDKEMAQKAVEAMQARTNTPDPRLDAPEDDDEEEKVEASLQSNA